VYVSFPSSFSNRTLPGVAAVAVAVAEGDHPAAFHVGRHDHLYRAVAVDREQAGTPGQKRAARRSERGENLPACRVSITHGSR